jgi:transcriptional regulator with XRE-family HTH domain
VACRRSTGEIDAHVGARMRARREQLGMSRDELARDVRASSRAVQSYETGTVRPRPARLSAIATALEVPISYFFDGADQSPGGTTASSGFPKDSERDALDDGEGNPAN